MTVYQIREMIAESGKMKVADAVSYVKSRAPHADIKIVKEQARSILAEARKFNRSLLITS